MSAMKVVELDINTVELDDENPRISAFLDQYSNSGPITSDMIYLALDDTGGSGTSLSTLRDAIKEEGGLIQPIIVNHTSDDRYIAIEGNTRLKIYQEFNERGVKGDWSKIPSIVYENMSNIQKNKIRLQAHLVGPREWSRYAKGKYLNKLYNQEGLTSEQVAEICGGGKSQLKHMLNAYIDMEKHYRPQLSSDDEFDTSVFSYFEEIQKQSFMGDLISLGFSKGDFAKWVIDGKISRALSVRDVRDILRSEEARNIFLQDKMTTDDAIKVLHKDELSEKDSETLDSLSTINIVRELSERISGISLKESNELSRNQDSKEVREYLNLYGWLKDLLSTVVDDFDEE